jgi:hypothetical protein
MLETVNDCIAVPHLPNWDEPPRLRRAWATEVASGIDGGEERAAGRATPARQLTYTVLADSPGERALLAVILGAALRSGRAACPLFGRAQDTLAGNAPDRLIVYANHWTWAVGDYAYLSLPGHNGINHATFIDAGGDGSGVWEPESRDPNFSQFTGDTIAASVVTDGVLTPAPDNVVNTSGVAGYSVPPQAVLNTARGIKSEIQTDLVYTIVNLPPDRPAKVFLWFVVWDPYVCYPAGNKFDVIVQGSTRSSSIQYHPYEAAGRVLNKAVALEFTVWPDASGRITITLHPSVYAAPAGWWAQLNAISVYSTAWQMLPIQSIEITYIDLPHDIHVPFMAALAFDPKKITIDLASVVNVYPVIYGVPSVGNMDAITNWHGSVQITVTEPPAQAIQGRVSACPTEVCGLPAPPDDGEDTPQIGGMEVDKAYVMTTATGVDYSHSPISLLVGWGLTPGQDPAEYITGARLAYNRQWLANSQAEFLISNPGSTFGPAFWTWTDTTTHLFSGEVYYQNLLAGDDYPGSMAITEVGFWVLACEAIVH